MNQSIYYNIKKFRKIVTCGFFTSKGGTSKGNFHSLNCSKSNKDNKINVSRNIKIALKNLNIDNKKLKLINQIHSNKTYIINDNNFNKKLYGDGLISKSKNIALGVLTADCAPIFLFDNKKRIICCLHSGWRGTLLNIIKEGINKIENNKIKRKDIIAIVGPCIAFKNYEVDKKFKSKFIKKNIQYSQFFKPKNNKKDLFNLRGLINYQLKRERISNIFNIKKDTYKNSQIFFSHRRMNHQNRSSEGRMINIISLKD